MHTNTTHNVWLVECKADKLLLKSAGGDYLHRPDAPSGVATYSTGIGNEWTIELTGKPDGVRLKSWKGDYLHRPDGGPSINVYYTGIGNDWTVEPLR